MQKYRTITKDRPIVEVSPMLRALLQQQPGDELIPQRGAALDSRRAHALERRATMTVEDARKIAGVEIEFLGIQPLFTKPRLYTAAIHDWVLAPATRPEDLVVPKREQEVLRRLSAADIDFPLIYTAHEVLKDRTQEIVRAQATPHTDIEVAHAAAIIGPVPDPHESVDLGDKLEKRTTQVLAGMRKTAIAGGTAVAGLVAAPIVLAGAVLAGLSQLDPIVLGAMPVGEPRDGRAAAWFVLARWDW
jgi:hypothetical protein